MKVMNPQKIQMFVTKELSDEIKADFEKAKTIEC